ncbi:MAG: flavodoxin domain-containing protein [ANME-2 cluster archaeon]|nr:flavodoxin domain-containing protein [ANME-2 cluster archaeon]MCL7475620.1 flavodoxin domain-containing protein [ANME-2 cluster archaeon]MDF1531552.1 flavodoxin domain-containing protein [ANME-2 cluster archaeon]MDW7776336.1 flavodoxin domain-containing protein [Methanosarcinales archaeon]
MPKLAVVYLSTQGNTKIMADALADGARSRNVDVEIKSFYDWKPEDAAAADAIAIGSSTFHYTILPPLEKFVDNMVKAGVTGKVGAAFGSYGWSGEAPHLIADKMRKGGINVLDPVLRVQYKPDEKDIKECNRLGKDLAEVIKKK